MTTPLIITGMLICVAVAQPPAAEGGAPFLMIRDPTHPISTDEIRVWMGASSSLGSVNTISPSRDIRQSAPPGNSNTIVAYGHHRDANGVHHEFEYDVIGTDPSTPFNATTVTAAANAWIQHVTSNSVVASTLMAAVAVNDDPNWPVIQTTTRHSEMQPYGKLTIVWELRKKSTSTPGKSNFALRTNAIIEPGCHAWPQSSKWTLDVSQPFLRVSHAWGLDSNNTVIQSFAPANNILGREKSTTSVQLLPSPAFSYSFTKPELTLVNSVVDPTTLVGTWTVDSYAHPPTSTPNEISQCIMPGSSAEIDTPEPNTRCMLVRFDGVGNFTDQNSKKFSFGFGDIVNYNMICG